VDQVPAGSRREVLAVLRSGDDAVDDRVTHALAELAEETGVEVAFVSDALWPETPSRPPVVPAERPGPTLDLPVDLPAVAAAVADGTSVEDLTRPLLRLLHTVTSLESTYLTLVDWGGDQQRIMYSVNTTDTITIPEGLTVPWPDTLCRRSLEEGRRYTPNVPEVWGDSRAARDLGIVTYVSVPVTDPDNGVLGTLCGVSSMPVELGAGDLRAMELFARLVGDQMNRERAHAAQRARATDLEARTRELSQLAVHDPLTGLLNRSGIVRWLSEVLPGVKRDVEQLAVAFIDVDRFKSVNDTLGHAAGDEVLRGLARALESTGRAGDLRGRLGGDEFVVAAVLPASDAAYGGWVTRLQRAAVVELEHGGPVTASVGAVGVTDPTLAVDDVLGLADGAMYQVKRAARAALAGASPS
jgi:diguanylate cyclase (GGDEF)-like protein